MVTRLWMLWGCEGGNPKHNYPERKRARGPRASARAPVHVGSCCYGWWLWALYSFKLRRNVA